MKDVIVDEVRRVREELIEQFGGIDGYFKHCQTQDRARLKRLKSRRRKERSSESQKAAKTV